MSAADVNSIVDNVFWWLIAIAVALSWLGVFDRRD